MASCGVTGVHSGHIKGTLISISLLHLFPPLSTHTFERNKDKRFTRSHKGPQEQQAQMCTIDAIECYNAIKA